MIPKDEAKTTFKTHCRCIMYRQITRSTRSHVSNSEVISRTTKTSVYPSSGSSLGGNSPMSSGLILMKAGVTKK
jgi:hypothetical protein